MVLSKYFGTLLLIVLQTVRDPLCSALEVQIKAVCIRLIPDQCLRLSVFPAAAAPRAQLTADQRAEGAGRCGVTRRAAAGEL